MVIRAVCCCLRRFRGHLVDSGPSWDVPHSSRGLGHRPLKAEITGSNPVCGTKFVIFGPIHARIGPLVALILGRGTLIGTLMPGPRSIWGGAGLVVEPQVRCRRLLLADVRRVERRAAEDRVETAH